MPDCQAYWEEVDRQAALFEAAAEAYEQAATLLQFRSEQLVEAIETAMACESGQLLENQERSVSPEMTLLRITKALKAIAKSRRAKK
jgi:hypothetical protein